MVTVTDRAAVELQEVLRTQNAAEGEGVKLVPSGDGRVQMTIGEPEIGDEVTRRDGQPLLIVDAILKLVRAGRPELKALPELADYISWGPGPRASQALMLVVRVRALLDGRFAPSLEDLSAMAGPTLRHRMAVTFAARAEGITVDNVIERLVRHVG